MHGEVAPFAQIAYNLPDLGIVNAKQTADLYISFKGKILALLLIFDEVVETEAIIVDVMQEVQWTEECPVPYQQTGLYLLKEFLREDRAEKLELISRVRDNIAAASEEIDKEMIALFPDEDFDITKSRLPLAVEENPEDSVLSFGLSKGDSGEYDVDGKDEFVIGVGTFLVANSKYHPDLKVSTEPGLTTCTGISVKAENEEGAYYGLGHLYLSGDGEKDRANLFSHVAGIREQLKNQGFKYKNMEFFVDYRKESYMYGFANEDKVRESFPGSRISFNRRLSGETSITVTKDGVIAENDKGENVSFKWGEQLTYDEEAAKDAAEHLGSVKIRNNMVYIERQGEREEVLPIFRIHSHLGDRIGFEVYRIGELF